jgi:hypothetical protein
MNILTQEWLSQHVGEPTGKWGSSYSEIHKLTGKFQKQAGEQQCKTALLINTKISSFVSGKHKNATTQDATEEKAKKGRALNLFRENIKKYLNKNFKQLDIYKALVTEQLNQPKGSSDESLKAVVTTLLEEMRLRTDVPLLENSGRHLLENVPRMIFAVSAQGAYDKGILSLNPHLLPNKLDAMATLVHECHHKLNPMPGWASSTGLHKYIDEFGAMWKEAEISRPHENFSRSDWINEKLKRLYSSAYANWIKVYQPLVHISQLGPYAVLNNAGKLTANDAPRFEKLNLPVA